MLSRLLEHYPTQWLKVTILEHPLKIQVTLISLGDCHIRFLKKIKKKKNGIGEDGGYLHFLHRNYSNYRS